MDKFLILFKHELKMQFPLRSRSGKKRDLFGSLLSALMIILISAVFVILLSTVVSNYVLVKVNKVSDPILRVKELLNLCYTAVIAILAFAGLENMRRALTDKKYKELLLRLPVKQETIFASKIATLLISNYLLAFILILTVDVIFYCSAPLPASFFAMFPVVWLLMPMVALLIATVLLVPYIKVIDFIGNKYLVMLVSVTAMIMGAFFVYSYFLEIVQSLLETGSIKFLFNEKFIDAMQSLLGFTYPANSFASIALCSDLLKSFGIVLVVACVAVAMVYFVSKKLFYSTLYKNEIKRKSFKVKEQRRVHSPLVSLMKKEFICIFRSPKNLFSYFAIAASMPVMTYCCYTLFESLILNAIGMKVSFPLATLTVLIFSILTNTFCATNVSRDGVSAIKVKTFPIKPAKILLAKVLLCAAVSTVSITVSLAVLAIATDLSAFDSFMTALIAIIFSLAQIFVATRMDLNGARLSSNLAEMRKRNNITLAKVIPLGILLALIAGILSVVSYVFSLGSTVSFITRLGLTRAHAYLLPTLVSLFYLGAATAYYRIGIDKSLDGIALSGGVGMVIMIILLILCLPLILMLSLFTATEVVSMAVDVPVNGIDVVIEELVELDLDKGESFEVDYVISPIEAGNKSVSFYFTAIGDEKLADFTVDGNRITPVSYGSARVIVETVDGGYRDYFDVIVYSKRVESISSSPALSALKVGESTTVSTSFYPSIVRDEGLIYRVKSGESVVSVSTGGVIRAIGIGTATVEVISKDNPEARSEFTVTVESSGVIDFVSDSVDVTALDNIAKIQTIINPAITLSSYEIELLSPDGTPLADGIAAAELDIENGILSCSFIDLAFVGDIELRLTATASDGTSVTKSALIHRISEISIGWKDKGNDGRYDVFSTNSDGERIEIELRPLGADVSYFITLGYNGNTTVEGNVQSGIEFELTEGTAYVADGGYVSMSIESTMDGVFLVVKGTCEPTMSEIDSQLTVTNISLTVRNNHDGSITALDDISVVIF